MAKYNLDDDIPYGIASADFSLAFYDRPQLAFANLLRGDVDGLTRAMLSPTTLTPTQMKNVRDVLMPGKKVNPILKTIMDITTNPLVIAGLVVGMWKFPLGTTTPLLALRKGLMGKAAAMGPMADGLHDAMMNLRSVPGMWESLNKVVVHQTEFVSKHLPKLNAIFQDSGPLSKADGLLIASRLDGLHKAEHNMVRLLRNEPEWKAFMGGTDVPIASNIQSSMSPRLISVSDKLRSWYNGLRSELLPDAEAVGRIKAAVEKRGGEFGETLEDYFLHHGDFDKYYKMKLRGTRGVEYRKWLYDETLTGVGRSEFARNGGMIADVEQLRLLEKTGAVKKGFADMAQTILDRWTAEAGSTAESIWNSVGKMGLTDAQQRVEFVRQMTDYYTKGMGKGLNFVGRLGGEKKATATLDMMAASLQDARFRGADAVKREFTEIGKVLARPPQYSLDPWEATSRSLHSSALDYSWHSTGQGKAVMAIAEKPNAFEGSPHIESYVFDDLIPHIRGFKPYQKMIQSLNYSVQKAKIANWVENHPMVEKTIGSKRQKWLLDYFNKSRTFSSPDALGGAVSSHFYLTTLGGNLASSFQNMLQTTMTTMSTVGARGMYYGLKGYAGEEGLLVKMERYAAKMVKGMKHEKAFGEAFPEFVKDAGDSSRIVESMLAGDVEKEGLARIIPTGAWGKIKQGLMLPFATTESGNRLLAYYAGRNTHLFQNAARLTTASTAERAAILQEAGEVGQSLNWISNFPGGPLGVPKALINLNPVWRQFSHFPLRLMGFLQGSLRLGPDPNKLDWGTIGRAISTATAGYIAARNLAGIDLSRGLLTGALPVPQYEKSPFYPFPFVPPIAQIGGTVIQDVLQGKTEGLGNIAAMLIPGGLAAKRAYQTLSPQYADYEHPTPDGRVPLYDRNKALLGTLSPMEIVLRSMGLRTTSISAEAGAAKWLLAQRDRLRAYRRDYTQALADNDTRKAEQIGADFQKAYPELGPLQIKKTDIKALQNRRELARLTRIERGIPTAYRPIFSRVIGEAGLGSMIEDIQSDTSATLQNYLPSQ